jgi:hypothetical protein
MVVDEELPVDEGVADGVVDEVSSVDEGVVDGVLDDDTVTDEIGDDVPSVERLEIGLGEKTGDEKT